VSRMKMSNLSNAQLFSEARTKHKKKKTVHPDIKAGDVLGEWKIINEIGKGRIGHRKFKAECSCGAVNTVAEASLRYNKHLMCSYCSIGVRRKNRNFNRMWMQ